MQATKLGERRVFEYSAQQLLDILDPLHLLLLFTHHTQGTSTITIVSTHSAYKPKTLT